MAIPAKSSITDVELGSKYDCVIGMKGDISNKIA